MAITITVTRGDGSKISADVPDPVVKVLDGYLADNPQYVDVADWIYKVALDEYRVKVLSNYSGLAPSVEQTAAALDAAKAAHENEVNSLLDSIVITDN